VGDVVLLREQAEVFAQRQQALEQFAGLVGAAVHGQRGDEPERASQELRLVPR
jgi:hypothetical protein